MNAKMPHLNKVLKFLSGKKGIIASVVGLIVSYLAAKGILGEIEVTFLMSLTAVLFGVASVKTKQMYAQRKTK